MMLHRGNISIVNHTPQLRAKLSGGLYFSIPIQTKLNQILTIGRLPQYALTQNHSAEPGGMRLRNLGISADLACAFQSSPPRTTCRSSRSMRFDVPGDAVSICALERERTK